MRTLITVVMLALALAASGCTFSSAAVFGPLTTPRDSGQVALYAAEHLDRAHDVVGMVVVQKDGSDPREGADELRRQAGAMGADAVIGVHLEVGFGIWNVGQHLSGTAVRYR